MAPSHVLHMGKPGTHYHMVPALTLAQDTKVFHEHRIEEGHMSHILCPATSRTNLSLYEIRSRVEETS